jgi:hypothetical protein
MNEWAAGDATRRWFVRIVVLGAACLSAHAARSPLLLARVDVTGSLSGFPLPVYAHSLDGAGREYVLVKATSAELQASGLAHVVLDSDADSADYIRASEFRSGAREAARGLFKILDDDGRRLLVRSESGDELRQLAEMGFQCRRLGGPVPSLNGLVPLRAPPPPAATSVSSNALVAEMMADVKTTNLYAALSAFTGAQPAVAGGSYTNIRTRHTNSGTPVKRATEYAYEKFNALGLHPAYRSWSSSGYSGRNVTAYQPGGSASSEVVVVCAHLDDMPSSGNASGADDNASGSIAVLTAAERLSKASFERTIRFVLFTGEEQGLLGSDAYAAAALASGDNIVAVFNMDMIAWDSNGDGILNLYTRIPSDGGYAADFDIASTFTNVVAAYGLRPGLSPAIYAESPDWSDHYSFWDYGFPAICAIEEDVYDFSDYYHTASDTLSTLNMTYYTRYVQAALGTVAHLAHPAGRRFFDAVTVDNGTFQTSPSIGVGTFTARREEGAIEGADLSDSAWSSMATNPNAAWLKIYTEPYATGLAVDVRSPDIDTIYRGKLAVSKSTAGGLTCTNRLRFSFVGSGATDCTYMVRVAVDTNYSPGHLAFECVTNLNELVAGGGFLNLPGLSGATGGAVYGTCDISRRFIDRDGTNLAVELSQTTQDALAFTIPCQPGTVVTDELQYATNLLPQADWHVWAVFTNQPAPDASNFESGWQPVQVNLDPAMFSNYPAVFFRLQRQGP